MFEELRHTVAHFSREPKLVAVGIVILMRCYCPAWLFGIAAEKTQDRSPQFSRIFLQIVKEIDAEVLRTNIPFPASDNLAGVRSDQHTRIQQIASDLLGIRGIEFIDHSE